MALDAPEAADAADAIKDAAEGVRAANERFRRRAAVGIGVLAMLLAISGLGGKNATKEMLNANILASDTFAFYQAKNIRQTSNQLAADSLQALLLAQPNLSDDARKQIQQRIDAYNATVARYESEPATGEGKQELLKTAQTYQERRDRAARRAKRQRNPLRDPEGPFGNAYGVCGERTSEVRGDRFGPEPGAGLGQRAAEDARAGL